MVFGFLSDFFSFFSILYGDQNFPILFWSFYKDSEFLSVFFMGIRISECSLDFFMGLRISECFLDFFMGIRISECFLDFFMGIRISKCFFRLLYGDQNFWMFYGLLYGDGNFWTFSFQIFMEIRNSEFSPESFSVLDKRLKNSLQSWNSNFAIHSEEIWYSEQRNKWFWKFYINFSIWSESEKLSVELSADIPFPKKLSIFFWSYFTLFFEQTWDTVGSITSRCSGRGSRPDPGDGGNRA